MARYDFASDNTAGAAPEALNALVRANRGFTSGYGTDEVTARAADLVRALLDADADVRFVASGTAANALSLAALCRPFEAVIAHQHAHVCTDETGAPGFFGHGLGLIGLAGASGRIEPSALEHALRAPDVSYHQSAAALSLTNATEYGTVYTVAEIARLTSAAKARGLFGRTLGLIGLGQIGREVALRAKAFCRPRAGSIPRPGSACWRAAPSPSAPATPTPWPASSPP